MNNNNNNNNGGINNGEKQRPGEESLDNKCHCGCDSCTQSEGECECGCEDCTCNAQPKGHCCE